MKIFSLIEKSICQSIERRCTALRDLTIDLVDESIDYRVYQVLSNHIQPKGEGLGCPWSKIESCSLNDDESHNDKRIHIFTNIEGTFN